MSCIELLLTMAVCGAVGGAIGHPKNRTFYGVFVGSLLGPLGWVLAYFAIAQPGKPPDFSALNTALTSRHMAVIVAVLVCLVLAALGVNALVERYNERVAQTEAEHARGR